MHNPPPTARRKPPCRHHAFTLIELLVVVSIIALLVAILLPALTNARDAAKTSVCLSRMKSMGLFHTYYQHDYKNYAPPNRIYNAPGGQYYWMDLMIDSGYVPEAAVSNTTYTTTDSSENYFICPGVEYSGAPTAAIAWQRISIEGSNGFTYHTPGFFGYGSYPTINKRYTFKTTDTLPNHSKQVITAEVYGLRGNSMGYLLSGGAWLGIAGPHPGGDNTGSGTAIDGTCNLTFLDGHAANVGPAADVQQGHLDEKWYFAQYTF